MSSIPPTIIQRNWFIASLLTVMVVGVVAASPLSPLAEMKTLQSTIVAVVMLLMAFPLKTTAIARSIRRPLPSLLATSVTYIVIPILAFLAASFLETSSAIGLLVVAATPCTMATAAVWTARAGGNDATALMTTIITNGSCFIVTPTLIWITVGQSQEIPAGDLAMKLLLLVLLPITLGQLLRIPNSLASFATRNKRQMNFLAQIGVLAMVLIGMVSTSRILESESGISFMAILRMGVVCLAIHLSAMWIGIVLARWLKMDRREQIAIAFSGSQKTLMVGLLVCLLLEVSPLPMVIYHTIQLVVDTLIADRFAVRGTGITGHSVRG